MRYFDERAFSPKCVNFTARFQRSRLLAGPFIFQTRQCVMAEVIKMPRLSDTMTEGVIAAWHKKVGDTVKKGELLAEVETDKATMDLESYKAGSLLYTGRD